jgi:hypothetical protein
MQSVALPYRVPTKQTDETQGTDSYLLTSQESKETERGLTDSCVTFAHRDTRIFRLTLSTNSH